MYLQFESKLQDGKEGRIPLLLDADNIMPDTIVSGVKIDGSEVSLDERIIATFQETVGRINTETLPPKHFRDCSHFIMAMCGLWMPTHPPLDKNYYMEIECEDNTTAKEHLGPVAFGIPNDSRCLGFGNIPFVYSHSAFGVNTSIGILCFEKLNIYNLYGLSTFDDMLAATDLEVSHPINVLSVKVAEEEAFKWDRHDETKRG